MYPRVSSQVWPEIMAVLAEGEMLAQPWQQDPADADVAPLSPGWKVVVGAYAGNEAVRQVVQVRVGMCCCHKRRAICSSTQNRQGGSTWVQACWL